MKSNILVATLFFVVTLTGIAQNTKNEKEADNSYFSLTFGLNMIDNSNGNLLPFDGGTLNFNTPFFLTAEQKLKGRWSLALSVSTNQIKFDNPAATEPYFSADLFANLFVDDLIFNNKNIDLYFGIGPGIHTVQGSTAGSFNFGGGFRYWISDRVGINLQSIGKFNKDGIAQVDNHYQFNLGVAFKFLKKEQSNIVTNNDSKENTVNIESVENQTGISQEVTEIAPSDVDDNAKRKIPEYNETINATSTDLGKTPEEKELIKKNAGNILNTKTLNNKSTDSLQKQFHVIIYAFRKKENLDNMKRVLTEKGIEFQVIKDSIKNFNYISIAQFNTHDQARYYIDNIIDKKMFEGSWIFKVD